MRWQTTLVATLALSILIAPLAAWRYTVVHRRPVAQPVAAVAARETAGSPSPTAVGTAPPGSGPALSAPLATLPAFTPTATPSPTPEPVPTYEPPAATAASVETRAAVPGQLTEAQMDALLEEVGWPVATRAAAKRVARCESNWRPDATGSQGERGLWQVHPRYHPDSTWDPVGNARAALRISRGGTDWSAWACKP